MQSKTFAAFAARALAPACFAAVSLADVHEVDASGNGQFTDIQAAISASLDGDVLLVRSGTYAGFTLDGRRMSIVADVGATPLIQGKVTVRNTRANGEVLLADLKITGTEGYPGTNGLEIQDCAGHVRIQHCTVVGGMGSASIVTSGDGGHGALITNSPKVLFVGSTLVGGGSGFVIYCTYWGGDGGHGVVEQGSAVAFYDCILRGGPGGNADYAVNGMTAGNGGDGCQVLDYGILASGCTFQGGVGGDIAPHPGNGGDGLFAFAGQAQLIDNTYTAGLGGHSYYGNFGQMGSPQSGPGVFHVLSGPARTISGPVLRPESGAVQFALRGAPGDSFWLVSATTPSFLYMPTYCGILCVPLPNFFSAQPLTVLPPWGTAMVSLRTPDLPAGTQSREYFRQGLVLTSTGQVRLASPSNEIVLNCSALPPDCNANASSDRCDILRHVSADVNVDGVPDECEPGTTWHVDAGATAGGNGSSGAPFQSLSQAFAVAVSGDTVLVADGLYQGPNNRNLAFNGRDLVVKSQNGAASCVLDCGLAGRAFTFAGNASLYSRIQGITVLNGKSSTAGGIEVGSSSPVIDACVFMRCQSTGSGGAIRSQGGSPTFQGCRFETNQSVPGSGGALYCDSGQPRVIDCVFVDNLAGRGGGAYFLQGVMRIERTTFLENEATYDGGAVFADRSDVTLDQCLLAGNTASNGGALTDQYSTWRVTNCTLVDNRASVRSGAAVFRSGNLLSQTRSFRNSVAWNNTAPAGTPFEVSYGPLDIAWCDVEGGQSSVTVLAPGSLTWGPGNLALDPLFADADGPDGNALTLADNDYRLSLVSPCIDAGENASVLPDWFDLDHDGDVYEPLPFDLDGFARFVEVPVAPNVGNGTPPLVDFGAWEHP